MKKYLSKIIGSAFISLLLLLSAPNLAQAGFISDFINHYKTSAENLGSTIESLPLWKKGTGNAIQPRISTYELGSSSDKINYGYFDTIDATNFVGIDFSAYVPYTGATADLNLGDYHLLAEGAVSHDSHGFYFKNQSLANVASFGLGGGQNWTFYDGVKLDGGTASRVLLTDASKNISYSTLTSAELEAIPTTYAKLDGSNHPFTYVKTPKIYPNADSTTAVQILKADGTTSVITVDTTNIQVGIGTTPLQTNLHVRGTTSANNYTQIWGASGASGNLSTLALVKTADVNGAFVFSSFVAGGSLASAPKIHFGGYDATPVNGAKFTMDIANGRFGIGTITPSYPLHIATTVTTPIYTTSSDTNTLYIGSTKGSSLATAQVQLSTPARNMVFASTDQASGVAGWYDVTAGAWRFAMTHSTGNVAIGGNNITPFGKLHVRTAASGAASVSSNADELIVEGAGVAGITILAGATSDASIFFGDSGSQTIGRIVYGHNANDMSFWTNATERVTITSSGLTGFNIAVAEAPIDLRWANINPTFSTEGMLNIASTDEQGANLGGSITLGGRVTTGNTANRNFASIEGRKANSTSGNTDGYYIVKTAFSNVLTERLRINELGFTIPEAHNFIFGETTGTKIGTATTQKIGFWNATPIVQPANTVAIDTLLSNIGLRAGGGDSNFDSNVNMGGDTYWTGAGTGLPYGEIYAKDVADTITFSASGVANKVQIDSFTTNGESNLTTVDYTTSDITIVKTGVYKISANMSVESGAGAAYKGGFAVYKNNGATAVNGIHAHHNFAGGGGDYANITMGGIASLTAGDTIEVWAYNEDNTNDLVVDDITLDLLMIGG